MGTYFEYIGDKNKVIIDDSSNHLMISRVLTLADCEPFGVGHNNYTNPRICIQAYKLEDIAKDEVVIAIRPKTLSEDISFGVQWHPAYSTACYIFVQAVEGKTLPNPNEIFVYLYTFQPKNSNSGIEIFNKNGNLIFSSSNALLNILDSEIIEDTIKADGTGMTNHLEYLYSTNGKKVAIAMLAPWSSVQAVPTPGIMYDVVIFYVSVFWGTNDNIFFRLQRLGYSNIQGESASEVWNAFRAVSPFSHFMLIDVTNIPVPE